MSLLCSILLSLSALLSNPLRTGVTPDCGIATLRVVVNGDQLARPVASLGGSDVVELSFDDFSTDAHNYYYKIIHCDADWRPSSLMPMEYMEGMDGNMLSDYSYSAAMPIPYIHYSLTFPNDDLSLTRSGNYAVIIARDNDFESQVVSVACLSIVEPMVAINGDYTPNSLKGINGHYQQLEFEVDTRNLSSRDVMNDFRVVVLQNGRFDNSVFLRHPTMVNGSILRYRNIPALTFEGGNQYRTVDFSSRYTYGSGIDHFYFEDSLYHAVLDPHFIPLSPVWRDLDDAHGAYVINRQGSGDYSDSEAEYVWVHFLLQYPDAGNTLPPPPSFTDVYLLGDMNYNTLDSRSRMNYDPATGSYYLQMLLKQGGINFQYIAADRNGNTSLIPIEGSFWQTHNRYEIFVYYRAVGDRYDRLVGYQTIQK